MAAYVIANVTITDPEVFTSYREQVPSTVEGHGHSYLARGGRIVELEGNWRPDRLSVLRFDSLESASAWYRSPEYQTLCRIRQQAAKTDLVLVEGI